MPNRSGFVHLVLLTFLLVVNSRAQFVVDTALYGKMFWREIGPFRSGRSIAVAGHADQPYTYYFGATGGGIWKTEDGGKSWINVSDGFLKLGVVGALEVAPSDPNVVYAGTGEACIRGNVMPGDGIYKSLDAGKTWKYVGLGEAQTISKIKVDPKDENLVYAAVFGHVFASNPERGIYRSKNGGKTWDKILYKNDKTGGADIEVDPLNSHILYAALWEACRTPWSLSSGGPGSGLYKSVDGGDSWTELGEKEGLPKGVKGRIGVAPSRAKAGRVWALIEADEGGLYRSDDWGKKWIKVNDDHRIRQRAWYYSHVYADPVNPDLVYILNVEMLKSIDGGKTLAHVSTSHSDNHDLWIDPNNPQRMAEANDGGASVTYNGGQTWTEETAPTGQFYHVVVDSAFPYNLYGAQQDNTTIRIASRTTGFGIDRTSWYRVGGGESGFVVPKPDDPEIVYAGSYDGYLSRYDHRTDQEQDVSPWPDNPMGAGAQQATYRFQWTYPILVSRFDPKVVYACANRVFKTTNEGMSWDLISPDLTKNDTSKFHSSGGPITKDNTSVEYYGTIFAFAESPLDARILWAGSDDGLVHLTTDGGSHWSNVSSGVFPPSSMISTIEASHFDPGTAYVAATRYKFDDFRPYLFRTKDFGRTWEKIVNGIPQNEFTHVLRDDPGKKGILYSGTERGIYISFDNGDHWQSLQNNLPVTPIHDIAVQPREKDLVVATHGRGFWILDDLTPLYQMADAAHAATFLFKPRMTYRMGGFSFSRPGLSIGKNPPNGVLIYYYCKKKPREQDSLKLEFFDDRDSLIKSFLGKSEKEGVDKGTSGDDETPTCPADSGLNRFVWDMRYPDAVKVPGGIMWSGILDGPAAVPGMYYVRLSLGHQHWTQSFEIKKDPRLQTSDAEFKEQFDFLIKVRDRVSEAHKVVNTIRDIRKQTNDLISRMGKHAGKDTITNTAKRLNDQFKSIEEAIIQVKLKSNEDALNYPIMLDDKIATISNVAGSSDTPPTKQARAVYDELSAKLETQIQKYKKILGSDLPQFNALVRSLDVPAVIVEPEEKTKGQE